MMMKAQNQTKKENQKINDVVDVSEYCISSCPYLWNDGNFIGCDKYEVMLEVIKQHSFSGIQRCVECKCISLFSGLGKISYPPIAFYPSKEEMKRILEIFDKNFA